jgi:hypothetical protein
MAGKAQDAQTTGDATKQRKPVQAISPEPGLQADIATLQRAIVAPRAARPCDILALQRLVGNRCTSWSIRRRARQPQRDLPISRLRGGGTGWVQCFGESQHAGIEQQALGGSFTAAQQQDIAFGNWANDFNQISLVGDFIRRNLGIQITNGDLFEIAQIIAEVEFGTRIAQRMTPERFGVYDPRQHFDNPATDPNAPADVGPVAAHIVATREHIRRTLSNALYADDEGVGREYFGSALHILEDFFAHTNFVEISLRLCGVRDINPRPGTAPAPGGGDRNQLVGGIFATADTVVSILHIVANYLQRPAEPDQPLTTGDRIALVLLRRQNRTLANAYERFCRLNYAARQSIPGYEWVYQQIQQFKARLAAQLGRGVDAASRGLTEVATGGGNLPAHSRLNKDDPTQPHFQLARALAIHVDQQVTPRMLEAWRLRRSVPPGQSAQPTSPPASAQMATVQAAEQQLLGLVDQYTEHPDRCIWWRPIVQPYATRMQQGSR